VVIRYQQRKIKKFESSKSLPDTVKAKSSPPLVAMTHDDSEKTDVHSSDMNISKKISINNETKNEMETPEQNMTEMVFKKS